MYQILAYAAFGAFGGIVRDLVSHKGVVVLPHYQKDERNLKLGFVSTAIIGAAAGILAPWTLGVNAMISLLCGYAGSDFIENLAEKKVRGKTIE